MTVCRVLGSLWILAAVAGYGWEPNALSVSFSRKNQRQATLTSISPTG